MFRNWELPEEYGRRRAVLRRGARSMEEAGACLRSRTTMVPDGHPQTQVMWVDAEDDNLLINTEVHRQKFKNVERDQRVTLTIWDREDPYRFVEVRGKVVGKESGPQAREHIDKLSHKYHGRPYGTRIQSERVILKIAPLQQVL